MFIMSFPVKYIIASSAKSLMLHPFIFSTISSALKVRRSGEELDTEAKWGWLGHTLNKPKINIVRMALGWDPHSKRQLGEERY